jgi:hypothetical protein
MTPAQISLLSKIVTETATLQDFLGATTSANELAKFLGSDPVKDILRKFSFSVHARMNENNIGIFNRAGSSQILNAYVLFFTDGTYSQMSHIRHYGNKLS